MARRPLLHPSTLQKCRVLLSVRNLSSPLLVSPLFPRGLTAPFRLSQAARLPHPPPNLLPGSTRRAGCRLLRCCALALRMRGC